MPGAASHPDQNSNIRIQGADVYSANGAIAIKNGTAIITKGSACALTLALPTAGTDDGKELSVMSTTAFAHTVTTPTNGLNGADHIATFGSAAGNCIELVAYNGSWWMKSEIGITLS